MKTAISIPDPIFRSAEELAAQLGLSRSELYSRALVAMLCQHSEGSITSRLNEVYGPEGEESCLDPALSLLQTRSIPPEDE